VPDEDREMKEREAKDKRAEAAKAVVRVIEADPLFQSRRRMVDLRLRLDRLLDAELEDLDRFLSRPIDEITARIRRDLGLDPEEDDFADPLPGSAGVPPASRAGSPRSGFVAACVPAVLVKPAPGKAPPRAAPRPAPQRPPAPA
jgi:hypothetical protein